ncbi:MAG: aminotransferase class V-fold PLP-dependent enzyme [Bacteroidetes bacterium]|nr:aminotransferase class V-fold PLP-dependent enzyme [Bacteroidota bacterium]
MPTRRNFIIKSAGLAGTFSMLSFTDAVKAADEIRHSLSPQLNPSAGSDEDFWGWVRESYTVSPNLINLNNGGVSPQPKIVQDAHIRYYQLCNEGPSYFMWRILDQGREPLRSRLADLAGCLPDEIAIDRNSTESLNTVIFGLNLKPGDEVALTKQDYPNMINAWKQREKRDGIKLVWINLDLPMENEDEIVKRFTDVFSDKTKVVHITHMINWMGQILPARKIGDAAHARGIEVLVDGAHTFAHIDYKIPDLHCDYFGTSLHKWLCAPFGSGLLYIKKDKIKNVWPLLSAPDTMKEDDIRKFETIGTRSFASEMAISTAVDFQNVIGTKRKEERLRFLKNYWAQKAAKIPGVKLHTSLKPEFSCALCGFSIEGKTPEETEKILLDKYKIHTVAINWENIKCVRVTPHVYTNTRDLDLLVKGIEEIAKK